MRDLLHDLRFRGRNVGGFDCSPFYGRWLWPSSRGINPRLSEEDNEIL